jgi:hypothetical protein
MLPNQIRRVFLQPFSVPFCEFAFNDDILTLQITELLQLRREGCDKKSAGACIEQAYSEGLLRPRDERPTDRHAT